MSSTSAMNGQPLHFPSSLIVDESGVVVPRPMAEVAAFAAQIAPEQLLPFLRTLINGTSKRKREPRWEAVNRQRMEIARICVERVLADRLYSLEPR